MSIPTTLLLPTVFWTGSGAARNHPAYGGSRSIRTTGHGVAIRRLSAWLWNRMVRKVRLELTRPLGHHGLEMTRLPVPSHAHMVGRAGFEPAVFPMSRFYRPLASASLHTCPNGSGDGIRTHIGRRMRPLTCQLSTPRYEGPGRGLVLKKGFEPLPCGLSIRCSAD